MDVQAFLDQVRREPFYAGQMVHVERIPPRAPRYAAPRSALHPDLAAQLRRAGIERLYTHQAQAVDAALSGRHVMVVTATASGKTLCYNLPVLQAVLEQPVARALYLFPTKALAQDQLRSLRALGCRAAGQGSAGSHSLPVTVGVYDGDTPQGRRAYLRQRAQVLLTNPDMLHVGILPNHTLWGSVFRHLCYVVVDEAHVYRGVFGSHVACVLRRLRRIAKLYGAEPQFIAASATIANPAQHFEALTGVEGVVITEDGSPAGPRTFVLWNPPLVGDRPWRRPGANGSPPGTPPSGWRRSANAEATALFVLLVRRGVRTIAFTRARKVAELILRYARNELEQEGHREAQEKEKARKAAKRGELGKEADAVPPVPPGLPATLSARIAAYRAGYTAEQRRQIERDLFSGKLLGVTATSALELGIDVGGLDAALLVGFPGTVASLWQQAGRAGRGDEPSLAVLIALDNPLDQYYMRHPAELLRRPHEHALIDPDNVYVLAQHLPCAAHEAPITNQASATRLDDEALFGPGFVQAMASLEDAGRLVFQGDRWTYAGSDYPAEKVSLRSIGGGRFAVLDESRDYRLLEEIEASTAAQRVHPGAVYLHQGESYLVTRFDAALGYAVVRPVEVDYYTQPRELSDVRIVRSLRHRPIPGGYAYLGVVRTTAQVVGYRRLRHYTDEVVADEPLDMPATSFQTVALWWDLAPEIAAECARRGLDFLGGIHAVEHACIGLLPLFAMCDRWDIGGLSTPRHPDTDAAQIFIYDGHPGGVGIAERGFEELPALWQATYDAIVSCPCDDGCPSCIQSPKCGNNNQPLDKAAARLILRMLV
ncbi:MAG: DEAD/DEAH box helicase [Anaerolineae bacterium]|nr:DEAD/DEAH box helicase [Anaerolineae bacterium]